jgi:hypothetical protein
MSKCDFSPEQGQGEACGLAVEAYHAAEHRLQALNQGVCEQTLNCFALGAVQGPTLLYQGKKDHAAGPSPFGQLWSSCISTRGRGY